MTTETKRLTLEELKARERDDDDRLDSSPTSKELCAFALKFIESQGGEAAVFLAYIRRHIEELEDRCERNEALLYSLRR